VLALGCGAASEARASELIDRNATDVRLAVDGSGQALLSYTAKGVRRRVLAGGAVNAVAPTTARRQTEFRLDYSGGDNADAFPNRCRRYTGPPLAWLVTACTAPDGSHWAVQAWQRSLPNYGLAPTPEQAVLELRLSHWTGEPARLEVKVDWAFGRFHHLYGRLTYAGKPVHGFRSTPAGLPLDTFGRNLFLDTFNSPYGSGWRRENSFLAQRPSGTFCYGFFERAGRPAGMGRRYRATVIGPGVTPDVVWQGASPGAFDAARDRAANAEQARLFAGSRLCRPN